MVASFGEEATGRASVSDRFQNLRIRVREARQTIPAADLLPHAGPLHELTVARPAETPAAGRGRVRLVAGSIRLRGAVERTPKGRVGDDGSKARGARGEVSEVGEFQEVRRVIQHPRHGVNDEGVPACPGATVTGRLVHFRLIECDLR